MGAGSTYLRGVAGQEGPKEEGDCVPVADSTQPGRGVRTGQKTRLNPCVCTPSLPGRDRTARAGEGGGRWPFRTRPHERVAKSRALHGQVGQEPLHGCSAYRSCGSSPRQHPELGTHTGPTEEDSRALEGGPWRGAALQPSFTRHSRDSGRREPKVCGVWTTLRRQTTTAVPQCQAEPNDTKI